MNELQLDDQPLGATAKSPPAEEGARARNGAPSSRVLAVIVTYDPEHHLLTTLVDYLQRQSAANIDVVIVDNSESKSGRACATSIARERGTECVVNPRNLGVAEAQNIGLRIGMDRGYEYALLLDQDSCFEEGAIDRLIAAHVRLRARGENVAAVGPAFFDARNGLGFPFVRLNRVRMRKLWPGDSNEIDCDILISSGCLISLDAVRAVGVTDAGFFIDYVDFEWCTRARAAGYRVFGVADARMSHRIGSGSFKLLGRVIVVHPPVRHYYLTRNAVLFARKPYLDLRWRVHLIYRALAQIALFALLAPKRIERSTWMLRGLRDGVLGRTGRLGGLSGIASPAPEAFARKVEDVGRR